jgi:hypothetical protein
MRNLALLCILFGTAGAVAQPKSLAFHYENGATLHLIVAPFDTTAFQIERCDYDLERVCAIDGALYLGSEGQGLSDLDSVLVAAELEVDGQRVPLDVSGMVNAYPRQHRIQVEEVMTDWGVWEVRGHFGDGGAVYDVEWEVRSGRAVRLVFAHAMRFLPDE